jgi:hypothetical protein
MRKEGTPEEQTGVRVLGEMLRQGLGTIAAPNMTPVAIRPVLENLMNYSFFMDRALESQGQMSQETFLRYGTSTSETAKAASKGLWNVSQSLQNMGFSKDIAGIVEMSPIKLENLYRGLLGTSAELSLSVGDAMVNPMAPSKPLKKSLLALVTGTSAMMVDPVGKRQLEELYALHDETSKAKKTYDKLVSLLSPEAEEYQRTHAAALAINANLEDRMKDITEQRKIITLISNSPDISPDKKLKAISEIIQQQNAMAMDVEMYKSLLIKGRRIDAR